MQEEKKKKRKNVFSFSIDLKDIYLFLWLVKYFLLGLFDGRQLDVVGLKNIEALSVWKVLHTYQNKIGVGYMLKAKVCQ